MDSARFLLAIVLTIAVVVVTNLLFPPAAQPPADEEPTADTVRDTVVPERTAEPETAVPPPTPEPADTAAVRPGVVAEEDTPEAAPEAEADTVYVTSPLYRYGFTTRGAGLVRAELLEFESFTADGPVQLVPEEARALLGYGLRVGEQTVPLDRLTFRVQPAEEATLREGESRTVRFLYDDPDSPFEVELAYTFHAERYVIDVEGRVSGVQGRQSQFLLNMGPALAVNEADPDEDRRALGYAVNNTREGIQSMSLEDVEARRIEEGPLTWVALKNKYFLAAALREAGDAGYFGGVIAEPLPGEYTADLTATLPVGRDQRFGYRLYLGPQDYGRLAELGDDLADVNPYGWRILRPIIRPLAHLFTWMLTAMHEALALGYGWVLILFGFLIQVVLWPLYARAARSQIRNMEIQPLLKEVQQKYKDQPEKLQKEMMRLYKEEGFNPLGGCLPMLIPFPVLITLFFVFQNTIEFRGVEFLWLPDLSRPDPLYLLPILLGASMFAIQWMSRRSMKTDNPQMKMMMWIMPAFMVVIFFNLASGLNLYYAASNVASLPRQMMIMRERRKIQGPTTE